MALPHSGKRKDQKHVRLPHTFLPSAPASYVPVPSHVNRCAPATTPDIERTYQVDVDGDGLIGAPKP